MINRTLAREEYQDGEVILFVDHDICFEGWPFKLVYDTFEKWFSEDPNLLLAHTLYDYPDKYNGHYRFRTNPLFAVRKHPRMITKDWYPSKDPSGFLRDTGRILCASLEQYGRARFIEMPPPSIHMHCHWIFKNNYDPWYMEHVVRVMKQGGFSPSEEELKIMKKYPAFRLFMSQLEKQDRFDPL